MAAGAKAAPPSAPVPWLREEDGAVVLALHVQPGAKRTQAEGAHGDALKVRLAAPPVDGKANAELVRFLAEAFGVPQRRVVQQGVVDPPVGQRPELAVLVEDLPDRRQERPLGRRDGGAGLGPDDLHGVHAHSRGRRPVGDQGAVRVGRVESIRFNPKDSEEILIRVSVNEDIPLTEGTVAKLGYQGLTGIAHILGLEDDNAAIRNRNDQLHNDNRNLRSHNANLRAANTTLQAANNALTAAPAVDNNMTVIR